MSTPVPASLNKSTTGRLIVTSAVGAALRVLGAVSPETADALTLDLFCRPQKPKRTLEPRAPGLVGHRFTVPFGDENIAVWDWGEGPTVLLVHGWNGCAAQMSRFIEPLVRAGYYVVAPDLPAHGASSGRRTNLFEFAEAVALLGRRVGPVHGVIAHSLGAAAAAIALARGLDVKRAVLLAPPSRPQPYAMAFADSLGLSPARASALLANIDRVAGGMDNIDLRSLGPSQRARALVLHDPADREVPVTEGKAVAETWPGAIFEALPGRGHTRLLRDVDAVRRAVAFVGEAEAPAALRALA
jgi:pimeloyl-ACP methyl ester carboxylesterase